MTGALAGGAKAEKGDDGCGGSGGKDAFHFLPSLSQFMSIRRMFSSGLLLFCDWHGCFVGTTVHPSGLANITLSRCSMASLVLTLQNLAHLRSVWCNICATARDITREHPPVQG